MTIRLLIVDDEPAIRTLVRRACERAEYVVEEAVDARSALARHNARPSDLVLLDLGLPDRDGLELLPLLRPKSAVIVLTARDATAEKVNALDLGADDYIVKPFDTQELLARVRTALRHRGQAATTTDIFRVGEITIDIARHRVDRLGDDVRLTRKEFALLVELAKHAGRIATHTALLREVWGEAHLTDVEYLRVAVRGLRSKLETDPSRPTLILNEPGVGYRLHVD